MPVTEPEGEETGRSTGASGWVKGVLTQPAESYSGRMGRFATGAARLVEAGLLLVAGVLIGGGLGLGLAMTRGNRAGEQMLGGAAIGAIGAVFRVTRYRHAVGVGVGALIGWNLCFSLRLFLFAPVGAILGGCLGPMLQRKLQGTPATKVEKARSGKAIGLRIVSIFGGLLVGGYAGGVIGAWLCMVVFFGAYLPSQLPRTLDQGGLLIGFSGLMGGVVGAVAGARCLYVWVTKREAARSQREDVLEEYQAWQQQHPSPAEDDRPDS